MDDRLYLEIVYILFDLPVALTCCDMFKNGYSMELKFKQEILEGTSPSTFLTEFPYVRLLA
jgi:hypothetical protein